VIIWINGTFGAGKSTVAEHLAPLLDNARTFDPELVGYMLRSCLADQPVADFQDWPAWRRLVVETANAIDATTRQDIIAVQTVLSDQYWTEIRQGLEEAGLAVFHVLVTADSDALRHRIEIDEEEREARTWRLEHLPHYAAAQPRLQQAADLIVARGAEVHTDGWQGYFDIGRYRFKHVVTNVSASGDLAHVVLPHVHRVASLLQRWLLGTHQGAISYHQLDYYLDAFTFRFNRRRSRHRGLLFYRLLEGSVATDPNRYRALTSQSAA